MVTTLFLAAVALGIALGALVFGGGGAFLMLLGVTVVATGLVGLASLILLTPDSDDAGAEPSHRTP